MRTLILGGGGREHALARTLSRDVRTEKLFCAPGNPGIAREADLAGIALAPPWGDLLAFCRRERIDLVVPGPEAPLAAGVADALAAEGVACFGPTAAAARLESSKSFAREVASAAGVPSHEWEAFDDLEAAERFFRTRPRAWWIKADGLAAGKGAVLPASVDEGAAILRRWMRDGALGESGRRVVIEEPLEGREVSVIGLVAGESIRLLPSSHDYKRLLDGDLGPNTGGMGAVAPTPRIDAEGERAIVETIVRPTLRELARRGVAYRGFLYAGVMLTASGPRLLEFNCRLGDPEAQAILPLLDESLADAMEAALDGRLSSEPMARRRGFRVVVVGAARGYPNNPELGDAIEGVEAAEALLGEGGEVYLAGARRDGDGVLRTSGGRVASVSAWGETLRSARDLAYDACASLIWIGKRTREDIGRKEV